MSTAVRKVSAMQVKWFSTREIEDRDIKKGDAEWFFKQECSILIRLSEFWRVERGKDEAVRMRGQR